MDHIKTIIDDYLKIYPDERSKLDPITAQLERGHILNDRHTYPGHITGAALVLSPDRSKLLIVHHKILQRWFQPGGHWEADETDPLEAARREALEETAVELNEYLALYKGNLLVPLDIDIHPIPANLAKAELEHLHYDFRYAFIASSERISRQVAEVTDTIWVSFDDERLADLKVSLKKLRNLITSNK